MKISLNWLTDFLNIKEKDTTRIVDVLTERSAEVDGIEDMAKQYENIVVGEILEITQHPDADKIRITRTMADKERQIICGASNIEVGQKVPVALPGAKMGDFVIADRKMRGVMSEGMICSESELGLSEESAGIMVLSSPLGKPQNHSDCDSFPANSQKNLSKDGSVISTKNPLATSQKNNSQSEQFGLSPRADAPIGQDFAEYMGLNDTVLDIDNTAITNRPDLFSHYGFARELVACDLASWKKEDFVAEKEKIAGGEKEISFQINIEDSKICSAWCGIELSGVSVKPSPEYMQKRLNACGIRPINNIVDITNYVMLELGMPMHAFDSDKIEGKKLTMRLSKKDEKMSTLDGKEHKLPENAIILEDEKGIFDLCGIMGGESSMVSDNTKNLLIHAPVYNPVLIRRASLALAHRTDASVIYEKGVPNGMALAGLMRTVELILESCPDAKVISEAKSIKNYKEETRKVAFDKNLLDKILGVSISEDELNKILADLGFSLKNGEVSVPFWRMRDISIPEDIVEEVVRIYGLNNISGVPPKIEIKRNRLSPLRQTMRGISEELTENSFTEVLNLAFLGAKLLKRTGVSVNENMIEIKNPLSSDQSLMRQGLLPRVLEVAEKNRRFLEEFRIFECARVFSLENGEKVEKMELCGLLVGDDFYTTKGVLESIFEKLKLKEDEKGALIMYKGKNIGYFGELSEKIAKEFSLPKTSVFVLDMSTIASSPQGIKKYKPLPKYPSITYDLSVLVGKKEKVENVLKILRNLDKLINKTEVIEVFEGKGVSEEEKSITISFEFRAEDRTLTDSEAKQIEKKIITKLESNNIKKRF